MNRLPPEKRAQVVACLVDGASIHATARITGVAKNTVAKLLLQLGRVCSLYQDRVLRNLTCKRIQCDEIWSFFGAKEKNTTQGTTAEGCGDHWTWTALDSETKLIPCWYVGTRDAQAAYQFMHDLAARLASSVQFTTDGHKVYLDATETAVGGQIGYAQLVKIYGEVPKTEARCSPAQCMGTKKAIVSGQPERSHISMGHVERANLSIRTGDHRFRRLANAFSRKVENHEHALALYFMHYNFCRIHQATHLTPAMGAGISARVWKIADIFALLDSEQAAPS